MLLYFVFINTLLLFKLLMVQNKYEPTWESLDKRPLPGWFDEAKIGIFIHWGVYSIPGFVSEWFWERWRGQNWTQCVNFMKKTYPDGFTYQEFAKDFTAEFFNPYDWAELFKHSGARYVILTSKHHEGYTLWPSKQSFGWNAQDVGPHLDLVGALKKAVTDKGLRFGLYHSYYEWFNPLSKEKFVHSKALPELYYIVKTYKPEIVWSDGDLGATDSYWESKKFLAWLYNESPVKETVVVNDRWGDGTHCKHGGFYSCGDRFNPGTLQKHKWENAMSIDRKSWGFRRNAKLSDYLTTFELIKTLVETVSCGGNILINVGPTKDGIIAPIFEERLLDLGDWLKVNGEAIYESKPWSAQNDTPQGDLWYTAKTEAVYAISLKWPIDNMIRLSSARHIFQTDNTTVTMLGQLDKLKWTVLNGTININLPNKAAIKTEWAWSFKITNYKKNY